MDWPTHPFVTLLLCLIAFEGLISKHHAIAADGMPALHCALVCYGAGARQQHDLNQQLMLYVCLTWLLSDSATQPCINQQQQQLSSTAGQDSPVTVANTAMQCCVGMAPLTSLLLHFSGPAAAAALNLFPGRPTIADLLQYIVYKIVAAKLAVVVPACAPFLVLLCPASLMSVE